MALAPMTDRLVRPDWVRRLNLMADAVGGDPPSLVPIDVDDLHTRAVGTAGGMPTGSFGDPSWHERFATLARAVAESEMHVVGRLMTKQELLRALQTRLLLTGAVDASPQIESAPVDAPVFITGPARSGTSILFELLALDPELRAPIAAEALHPLPSPGTQPGPASVVLGECEQELWADVQPEFQAIHELRSDLPVECVTITQGSFCGFHWSMIAQLDGWLPDPVVNYDYERRFLQVLQHDAAPRRWLLKTPAHLMLLRELFEAFPGAWVVQTHRDPAKTIPSTVSTTAIAQWMRTDNVDVDGLAAVIDATFTAALNDSAALRESGDLGERFADVHFDVLVRDPVTAVRDAYQQMGRELTEPHALAIHEYVAAKPRGKFGTHQYRPQDWGFTARSLRKNLARYIEFFGVPLEDA